MLGNNKLVTILNRNKNNRLVYLHFKTHFTGCIEVAHYLCNISDN